MGYSTLFFRRILGLVLITLFQLQGFSQTTVQVVIDGKGIRTPVSPYIYGKNNSLSDNPSSPVSATNWQRYRDAGITMFRESGGNNSTKYNWRRKLSSHPDWYNNVYAHNWDYAVESLQKNIPEAQGMWTLSLIGRTALTSAHNFGDWAYNQSQWWSGVNQNLAGGGSVNPEGGSKALKDGDPSLYLTEWPADSVVGILNHWMGEGGLGLDRNQLLFWNMDNEPEIWNGTHDDVMPVQLAAEAFMQRYFETAKKARALFPEIKLMGPIACNEWQWYNWNNDAVSSGSQKYVWLEFFIKRIAEEQKASGIRLLDLLDIHFYPGETTPAQVLQVHRIFFDRNYAYPGANGVRRIGGWTPTLNKEYIFGRCQEWLDKYMGPDHGVTLAVTEMSLNGTPQVMVNALWYASMLGEFARQGVEVFTPWDWRVGMYEVVHLFSRYNHSNYLPALSSDEEMVSAYPTVNENSDSMTIVLVNRSLSDSREVMVTLDNFIPGASDLTTLQLKSLPATETFVNAGKNALVSGITPAGEGGFSIVLPPLSVTSVLVAGNPVSAGAPSFSSGSKPKLTVFPNPATTGCRVGWIPDGEKEGLLQLFDLTGRLISNVQLGVAELENGVATIQLSSLTPGNYMVRVVTPRFNDSSLLVVGR